MNPGPSACEADVIPLHHVPDDPVALSLRRLNIQRIRHAAQAKALLFTCCQIRGSIVVSISACHAEDPGSIPGRGVLLLGSCMSQKPHERQAVLLSYGHGPELCYESGNSTVERGPNESQVMLQTHSPGQNHTSCRIAALAMQHDSDANKRSQGGSNSRP